MRQVSAFIRGPQNNSARTVLSIALLISFSYVHADTPPLAAAPPLWEPTTGKAHIPITPQAIHHEAATIDIRHLQPPPKERVSLILPPNRREVTAHKVSFEEVGKKQFVWRGIIEGDPDSVVTFSLVEDTVVGNIVTSRGELYRVRFAASGTGIVEQLNRAAFPPEDGLPQPKFLSLPTRDDPSDARSESIILSGSSIPLTTEAANIDIMVLYTNAAAAFSASGKSVLATINEAVSDAKQSYLDSDVHQKISVVHVGPVPVGTGQAAYQEKSNIGQDWSELIKNDGELAAVHDLRREYDADIVALITKPVLVNESSCGQALQMHTKRVEYCKYGFVVVPVNCATGIYSFAHELGHIMGAGHMGVANSNLPYPYSHGYEDVPSKAWYTIMATSTSTVACVPEQCPRRILRWSNPDLDYGTPAKPTGIADVANNALTLNNTASTVANFSVGCSASPP